MAIRFQDSKQLFRKIRDPIVSGFESFFRPEKEDEIISPVPKEIRTPFRRTGIKKEEEIKEVPWQENRKVIASLESGLDIDTRNATMKWQDLVNKHFGDEEMANTLSVMFKESSGRADAVNANRNGSKDYGLMQINDIHAPAIKKKFGYSMEELFDPDKNLEVAKWIWERQGWRPWVGAKKLGLVK